jgi:hypothetical protein
VDGAGDVDALIRNTLAEDRDMQHALLILDLRRPAQRIAA